MSLMPMDAKRRDLVGRSPSDAPRHAATPGVDADRFNVFDEARIHHARVVEADLSPPWCVRVPPNDQTYLFVVRSGEAWLHTEDLDEPLRLRPGDLVTLVGGQAQCWRDSLSTPPTATHRDFASSPARDARDRRRTRILLLAAPRDSNRFVSVYPRLVAIPRSERRTHQFLDRVLRLIELEHAEARPGHDAVLKRLSELLVIELVRYALPRLPAGGSWLAGLTDPRIGSVLSALQADPGRQWTLASMAAIAGTSRAVFTERFARLVGESPQRYLRRIRLHLAADALQRMDRAIIEIAADVGYHSESAFNKAFVREMSITPARYRRQHRRPPER
jgi:AraC-like DNA-binding protein